MNNGMKALLAVGILAALVGGALALFGSETGTAPDPSQNQPATTVNGPSKAAQATGSAENTNRVEDEGPSRVEVEDGPKTGSGDNFAQGVTGRIIDPSGANVAGAEVYLIESLMNDPFMAIEMHQKGQKITPVAMYVTEADGLFSVGIENAANKSYELMVVHDRWSQLTQSGINPPQGDWYNAGDLQLEPGIRVYGNVTDEITGAGIMDATVKIAPAGGSLFGMVSIPDREDAFILQTDAQGFYELPNAPAGGIVINVESPNHADVIKNGVLLKKGLEHKEDFILRQGYTIAGGVVTSEDAPVANATVEAVSLSPKDPQRVVGTTDKNGRFVIPGLLDAPFQLTVRARGYEEAKESPIISSTATDLRLVVEQKGFFTVRVQDERGRPVSNYRMRVLRWFPANQTMGIVPDTPPYQVRPADLTDGTFKVAGVGAGDYLLEVKAKGTAKSFSDQFQLARNLPGPEVTVTVKKGATIVGRVTDGQGNPIAGATVATETEGQVDMSGLGEFGQMFGSLAKNAPKRIATVEVTTKPNGTFRMNNLPVGEYQLRLRHGQFVGTVESGITLEEPREYRMDLTMASGCTLIGVAGVNGLEMGQLEIRIGTPVQTGAANNIPLNDRFNARTMTRNDGTFQFLQQVPPGTYEITASRKTAGPFLQMIDHKTSKQTITVAPGQKQLQVRLNIQANN